MSEVAHEEKLTKKATAPKKKAVLKKLDAESAKVLQALRDRANKKSFGRKVRDSEILALGLSLLNAAHIQQLQNQTLSEKDRLHIAHEEYQRTNGKISLDHFIGKLLNGEFLAQHKDLKN